MRPIPKKLLPALLFLAASSLILPTHEVGAQGANPAPIQLLATAYADLDGDHDAYPDTGETGRVTLTVKNTGAQALTGIVFNLVSTDADVTCITEHAVSKASLAPGEVATIGSLTAGPAGFTFRASDSLNSVSPTDIAKIDMCLIVTADGIPGLADPICFQLLADIDLPAGPTQTYTLGPDGIAGTTDDGTMLENFDIDKNGDGVFTVDDTFRTPSGPGTYTGYCSTAPQTACATSATCPSGGTCYTGSYIRGDAAGMAQGLVAGVSCGGFDTPATAPLCSLDPDYPMDWHLHCPHGATDCPNLESGTCVGGCSFDTPTGGNKSHSGSHSLHMGAHFSQTSTINDTTHFRTLQGFQSAPMNLALLPAAGDLEMSFFHIARLMDNNQVGPGNNHQCVDCGDVQIRLDQDADPAVDNWGFWDKLAPFENVYDHTPNAYSVFGSYYCLFTPADTGNAAPAPNGAHETLCHPMGAWSHCGTVSGTTPASVADCAGPGELDQSGIGVWAKSRFNLAGYLGQRIEIRWIGETWLFDYVDSSYYEVGSGWDQLAHDDGWWLDDIRVTGTITGQLTPTLDSRVAPPTSCSVAPDLSESTLSDPPGTIHPGEVLNLTDTAVNLGDDNVGDSVTGYYLSLDTAKDGSDTPVASRSTGPLAAGGGSSAGSVSPTVPLTVTAGNYHVLACADDSGTVTESAETNNCRASATTVQVVVDVPDLVESALTDPPASALTGSTISVGDTATNQGTASAGSSTTQFYLSTDITKDAGDASIGARSVGTLAAGAFSAASTPLVIPGSTAGGLYYLIACADVTGQVSESDEANNCRTSTTTVQVVVASIDLVESALTNPPASAVAGSTISVGDTVTNQGTASAGSSTTQLYLSTDTTKDAGDASIGSRSVGTLAAGASSAGSTPVVIPGSTAGGLYYLIACADVTGQMSESDETNNCRTSTTQLLVTKADLVETVVSNPPAKLLPGASFTTSDTTKNQGNGTSGMSFTRYYLALGTVRAPGDVVLGTRTVGPIAPGAVSNGVVTLTVPASTPGANYYMIACADNDQAVPESDESNNCRTSAKQTLVTRADLVETTISNPPATAIVGRVFTVSDTAKNAGTGDAPATFTRYYLSMDTLKNAGDLILGTRNVVALQVNKTSSGSASVTIPANAAGGTWFLLACADDGGAVSELDETNNCRASTKTVHVN